MTKADLVDEIAKALDSKQTAKAALDSLLEAITGALKKGDSVTLDRFWHVQGHRTQSPDRQKSTDRRNHPNCRRQVDQVLGR